MRSLTFFIPVSHVRYSYVNNNFNEIAVYCVYKQDSWYMEGIKAAKITGCDVMQQTGSFLSPINIDQRTRIHQSPYILYAWN